MVALGPCNDRKHDEETRILEARLVGLLVDDRWVKVGSTLMRGRRMLFGTLDVNLSVIFVCHASCT